MPSTSKKQQRFMGMVHAAQTGKLKNPSTAVKKVAKTMKKKDAKDFASTEHKGLPEKVKETVQNVVFKESVRAKMVNESGDYPWGAENDSLAPYNDPGDNRIKYAEVNRDGDIVLSWYTSEDEGDEETEIIDSYTLNSFLSSHFNLDLEKYQESGESIMTDFEEVDDNVYKISGPAGDYIIVSFDDLANLTS